MEEYHLLTLMVLVYSSVAMSDAFISSFLPYLSNNCDINYFNCGNGECIPKEERCDSIIHCADSSDEKDCGK